MSKFSSRFNDRLMAIASTLPDLLLQSAYQLPNSTTAFRVNVTHANAGVTYSEEDYGQMILNLTDKKFALVAGTMAWLDDVQANGARLLSGIVEANLAVKEFKDDEVQANYRSLAANVFIDNEDSIWRVVENNGVKQLVQSVNEDFKQLIASRIARKASQVIAANYPGMVPATGDYVQYYNEANRAVQYGFALISADKGIVIVDRNDKQEVNVSAASVLTFIEGNSLEKKNSLASKMSEDNVVTADDMTRLGIYKNYLDYMKTLFSQTDYYNRLENLLTKNTKFQPIVNGYPVSKLVIEKN